MNQLQEKHEKDRQSLIRDLSYSVNTKEYEYENTPSPGRLHDDNADKQNDKELDTDVDFEPEI